MDDKKKSALKSWLLTIALAVGIFFITRWVFSWLLEAVVVAICLALAYRLLRALGIIHGKDSEGDST